MITLHGFSEFEARGVNEMRQVLRALCVLALTLPAAMRGQGLGEMVGVVTDPSGAVISGARVTATEVGTGFNRSVVTSAEGFFTIPSLRPSDYNLSMEASGFRSYSRTGITLAAD